jgi:WhiB family redox-sensing transcriptional regulator
MSDWRDHAACRHTPTDSFYPASPEAAEFAISICRRCPVAIECLRTALDLGEHHGIWGGTTPDQRKNIMRRARRTGRPVDQEAGRR